MPPLETLSPFDFLAPEKQDVFFMGSLSATKLDQPNSNARIGKLKKVLSVPKSLKNEASGGRRRSLSNLFKGRSRKSSITEDEIGQISH